MNGWLEKRILAGQAREDELQSVEIAIHGMRPVLSKDNMSLFNCSV